MTNKVNHFKNKARDRDFEPFQMWAISKSYAYAISFDEFWAVPEYRPLKMHARPQIADTDFLF